MLNKETDKKLEAFTNAIYSKAIEESHVIAIQLQSKENELIKKAEAEISAETNKYKKAKKAEIKATESRRVNAKMTENKRALLQYRKDCATQTYSQVIEKLKKFTESDEYLPKLKELLTKGINILGENMSEIVYLRPEDMHFADELKAYAKDDDLSFAEGHFALGGLEIACTCKSKKIDLSFDSAMEDMVGHFSELSGLSFR